MRKGFGKMSKYRIVQFTKNLFEEWNKLIGNSSNGTIFHRLDFLSYHGQKFEENEHHLIIYKGDTIFGIMPMGLFTENGKTIAKSPFGASWGGPVFAKNIKTKDALEVVTLLLEYLNHLNINRCIITVPPTCYHIPYSFSFEFGLLNKGFKVANQELTHVVPLPSKEDLVFSILDSKSRNKAKNALANFDFAKKSTIEEFYPILLQDKQRLGSKPTHTFEELKTLNSSFPNEIYFDIAIHKETKAKAGICYFVGNKSCISTFNLSQEDNALGLNGVNALIVSGMKDAVQSGYTYFDFGCSSYKMEILNIGVSDFKESFGANGLFRNTYQIAIS